MTVTVATRMSGLSVIEKKLEDMIIDTIGPVTSFVQDDAAEAVSISFTVPSTARVGDSVELFLSWRIHRFCIEFLFSSMQIVYMDSQSKVGAFSWEDDALAPGYGLARFEIYELEEEDIGATFTITLHDCETGTLYHTSPFSPILYGVVLNGSHYEDSSSKGYQEVPENDDERLEITPITSTENNQLFFYSRTMFPTGDSDAPFLATELCDVTSGDNSLFVAVRLVASSGTTVDYPVDSDPNISMLSSLVYG